MRRNWSLHAPVSRNLALPIIGWILLSGTTLVQATKVDITGPPGGVEFGASVMVLSNGNIVVPDYRAPYDGAANVGAVHLYSRIGVLISTLRGSRADDYVGGAVYEVGDSNFVVVSSAWDNGSVHDAGAVTWVDGEAGLDGVVSPENSLVGGASLDWIGSGGVVAVGSGKYVVISPRWSNGMAPDVGAVTLVDGNFGLTGYVSSANSMVGTSAYDSIGGTLVSSPYGGVVPLNNGNYVVVSPDWDNGSIDAAGAVTWVDGSKGLVGPVSVDNSLVGTTTNDRIGVPSVTGLANGNYVVASRDWHNPGQGGNGAATWGSGLGGLTGPVSLGNSLVGTAKTCCNGARQVTPLTNGNYVVTTSGWSGLVASGGAVTWANGNTGLVGTVSVENSLVGTTANDLVGYGASPGLGRPGGVTALANGNYVVASEFWDSGLDGVGGAATWADGEKGLIGVVSIANSLVGTGFGGVVATPLTNGNYVVTMPYWHGEDGSSEGLSGAVTWADGTIGLSGLVSAENSLVHTKGIYVGPDRAGVTALGNGNYVIASPGWDPPAAEPPAASNFGAITWGDGSTGIVGQVSADNSMIGTSGNENVGSGGVIALTNGNYVFSSPLWPGSPGPNGGAVTWAYGGHPTTGEVGPENSLVGAFVGNGLIPGGLLALEDGNYVMASLRRLDERGLVILGNGNFPQVGTVREFNSVMGVVPYDGPNMVLDYDVERSTLVVGRPGENMVTLLSMEWIFAGSFE